MKSFTEWQAALVAVLREWKYVRQPGYKDTPWWRKTFVFQRGGHLIAINEKHQREAYDRGETPKQFLAMFIHGIHLASERNLTRQ